MAERVGCDSMSIQRAIKNRPGRRLARLFVRGFAEKNGEMAERLKAAGC